MTLMKDLAGLMRSMERDLGTSFADPYFGSLRLDGLKLEQKPSYRTKVDAGGLTLKLDVPGVEREKIAVEFLGRTLSILASGDDRVHDCDFTINEGFDVDNSSAKLSNGVLTVTIPRSEKFKTRSIKIE